MTREKSMTIIIVAALLVLGCLGSQVICCVIPTLAGILEGAM